MVRWYGRPPGEPPEIVLVAIVEYGESGGQVAAPIVAKAADYYLRSKRGMPIDTIQTYREHILSGPVPKWYRDRFPRGFETEAQEQAPLVAAAEGGS